MTAYLLDTNACIALINGRPERVRLRLEKAIDRGHEIVTSAIVLYELWYGVAKSSRPDVNTRRLETFLAGPVRWLAFDETDARHGGMVRAQLESAGKPVGAYDTLIAAQALRHGLTLVTANVREFSRVKGLTWEDWAKA